jgi:deoxyribonuclease V
MNIIPRHEWNLSTEAAIFLQQQLAKEVISRDELDQVKYIAGVDLGYSKDGNICKAVVVVLNFPELQLQEVAIADLAVSFPYIPGLLSFREVPSILAALEQLKITPNLILCDGQGMAHPRRFGLACHLGIITNIPTIGVAKSWLIGTHETLPLQRGSWQPLRVDDQIIGAVLRTQTVVKPVYVSIGHKISLITAIDYVLKSTTKYRLPETTRWADHLSKVK